MTFRTAFYNYFCISARGEEMSSRPVSVEGQQVASREEGGFRIS